MQNANKNIARVALYDPVRQNLRSTRYTLSELSFREVDAYSDFKEMKKRVTEHPLDLLVCETDEEGKAFSLVKDIRNGNIGLNPFAVIFLTCWNRDPENVHAAIDSGADDLIARPFSTNFIESRVAAAISRRKRFVITSDYIGPDRRSVNREGTLQPRFMDPPNTLKAASEGDVKALEKIQRQIETERGNVVAEQARRLAIRIAADFDLTDPTQASAELSILKQARQLLSLTENVGEQPASMARSLVRTMTEESKSTPEKRWRVGRELALGVSVACASEATENDAAREIDALVNVMKEKNSELGSEPSFKDSKRLNSAA